MTGLNQKITRRSFLKTGATLLAGTIPSLGIAKSASGMGDSNENAKIGIIIDDIGFSRSRAKLFLNLDIPLTFSVLPRLSQSLRLANEIHDKGQQIMLHQPMEPKSHNLDPGPGALYLKDNASDIMQTMSDNIASLPNVSGVNNHMGSKFTESHLKMLDALGVVRERKLFFIDSLTTFRSKAHETAKSLRIATLRRNVFIDFFPSAHKVCNQLMKLQGHAIKYGRAVGIGHPFPHTARGIELFLEKGGAGDVKIVHISEIMTPA